MNWDQRGAGKSYRAIRDADRMNIDQFVADTRRADPVPAGQVRPGPAPSKELIWFGASAHLPNSEERDLFNTVMMTKVLPVASRQSG